MVAVADQPRTRTGLFIPVNALNRFREKCVFEPDTGCVVWAGGTTSGRGHHVPYGAFWFEGRRWFAHRWAAKHIHGLDIDELQVDHYCPNRALPNTLCVEHLQVLTLERNRHLQTERRKLFIHLEVGLARYEDIYGPDGPDPSLIPWYSPPEWLATKVTEDAADCPF